MLGVEVVVGLDTDVYTDTVASDADSVAVESLIVLQRGVEDMAVVVGCTLVQPAAASTTDREEAVGMADLDTDMGG